jgi:hypothetical protein
MDIEEVAVPEHHTPDYMPVTYLAKRCARRYDDEVPHPEFPKRLVPVGGKSIRELIPILSRS